LAIAYVRGTGSKGTGSSSSGAATQINAGDFVLIHIAVGSTSRTVSSFTLGAGNNATLLDGPRDNGSYNRSYLYYYKAASTLGSVTPTLTLSGTARHAWTMSVYTGVSDSAPYYDGTNYATGSGASPITASVQITSSNMRIAVTGVSVSDGSTGTYTITIAPAASETERQEQDQAGGSSARAISSQEEDYFTTSSPRTNQATGTCAGRTLYWVMQGVNLLAAPEVKNFSDVGGGSDAFLNPYRAMGFAETGHGTEGFAIPFKALGFADAGVGTDAFNLFLQKTFNDSAVGSDAFSKVVTFLNAVFQDSAVGTDAFSILFKAMVFSEVASGIDAFATPYRAMGFSDSGHGADMFSKIITFLNVVFQDVAVGADAFSNPFRALSFADAAVGIDVFLNVFRTMGFSDQASAVDAFSKFITFLSVAFQDEAAGSDMFLKEIISEFIEKYFADQAVGTETFAIPFKALMFSDSVSALDKFEMLFRVVQFFDSASVADIFEKFTEFLIEKGFLDSVSAADGFVVMKGFSISGETFHKIDISQQTIYHVNVEEEVKEA
jgi:hypothetical protein